MFDIPELNIRLRAFGQPTDLDNIMKQENDAEIAPLMTKRFIVPRGGETYREMIKNDIEKHTEMFCIIETILPASVAPDILPEFVGATALWKRDEPGMRHVSFSIVLQKEFWNKGFGTRITQFVVDHAFLHLNMHRISLGVFEGNDRAIAVYKNCGFVIEGVERKSNWYNGMWRDATSMGILHEDWIQKRVNAMSK